MSTINMTLAELRLLIEKMPEDTMLSVEFPADWSDSGETVESNGDSVDLKAGE